MPESSFRLLATRLLNSFYAFVLHPLSFQAVPYSCDCAKRNPNFLSLSFSLVSPSTSLVLSSLEKEKSTPANNSRLGKVSSVNTAYRIYEKEEEYIYEDEEEEKKEEETVAFPLLKLFYRFTSTYSFDFTFTVAIKIKRINQADA